MNIIMFQAIAVVVVFVLYLVIVYSKDTLFNLHAAFNVVGVSSILIVSSWLVHLKDNSIV